MTPPRLRQIALVLLLLSFSMFSGLATTITALVHPQEVDACCDRNETPSEPMSGPCSEGDCLCFSCLAIDRVEVPVYLHPLKVTSTGFYLPQAICPDGFSALIDYPPEIA